MAARAGTRDNGSLGVILLNIPRTKAPRIVRLINEIVPTVERVMRLFWSCVGLSRYLSMRMRAEVMIMKIDKRTRRTINPAV